MFLYDSYFSPAPSYIHEWWYPLFLMVTAMNFLVIWGALVMNEQPSRPRNLAVIFGGLGMLLALHPQGMICLGAMNFVFSTQSNIPIEVRLISISFGISAFGFFWYIFLAPALCRVRRTP